MRRLLIFVLAAAAGLGGWIVSRPGADLPVPEDLESATAATFAVCPWTRSGGGIETVEAMVGTVQTTARLTHAALGEVVADTEIDVPGGALLPLTSVSDRAGAELVFEFGSGPVATATVVSGGPVKALDRCPSTLPEVWYLPGGSTRAEESLTLHLFNPFAQDAVVAIRTTSELGVDADPALENVTVPPRTTRELKLDELLEFRDWLSVVVEHKEGSLVPSLAETGGADWALWTGTGESMVWEFPIAATGRLAAHLVLVSASPLPVDYELDVMGLEGGTPAVMEGTIEPNGQVVIPLAELGEDRFGVRVSANAPIGAAVVGSGPTARAVTSGVPAPAARWLLPGAGLDPESRTILWVMNSGSETVEATFGSLGEGAEAWGSLSLGPGTVVDVMVDAPTGAGLLVEATGPVSVAWSDETANAVGWASGAAVDG